MFGIRRARARRVCIVSTYPKNGSRNVGDALIASQAQACLDAVMRTKTKFTFIYRAEAKEIFQRIVAWSDFVLLPGFAIRERLQEEVYPGLSEIVNSGKPFAIMSAGTSLGINKSASIRGLSNDTVECLRELDKNALFFTTRGILTQRFCQVNGVSGAAFAGDVAFVSKGASAVPFRRSRSIRRIGISDPHRSTCFLDAFNHLVSSLQSLWPEAKIEVLVHSASQFDWQAHGAELGIGVRDLSRPGVEGLESYKELDLHVGFRVHGHVSALKCGIPSYLLEQDGRGLDYGLSFPQKLSLACVGSTVFVVDQMLAMIEDDWRNGFRKFEGVESRVQEFIDANRASARLVAEVLA